MLFRSDAQNPTPKPSAKSASGLSPRQKKTIIGSLRNRHYQEMKPLAKRISAIEQEMGKLTLRQEEIEAIFVNPQQYKDGDKIGELHREYHSLKAKIETATAEWETLTLQAEEMAGNLQQEIDRL